MALPVRPGDDTLGSAFHIPTSRHRLLPKGAEGHLRLRLFLAAFPIIEAVEHLQTDGVLPILSRVV
jgi:hypothetical protein